MGFQQPAQQMLQQQLVQQGAAGYSPQQQVVAAAAAAAVQNNPWGAAYNPYQQYTAQVSCYQWKMPVMRYCCNVI